MFTLTLQNMNKLFHACFVESLMIFEKIILKIHLIYRFQLPTQNKSKNKNYYFTKSYTSHV